MPAYRIYFEDVFCSSKMAEDCPQTSDEPHPHPPVSGRHRPYDSSDSHLQPVTAQAAKGKLHQQRQKCELRRLLKHTHPELKRLDDVLDEELAEVLSSDTGDAAGESGYEGEVLSRRLIFENCASADACFAPKPALERSENSKNCEAQERESVKHTESDDTRIDVRATTRSFEGQSVRTLRENAEKSQSEVSVFKEQRGKEQMNRKKALDQVPLPPRGPGHRFSGPDGGLCEDETSLLHVDVEDKIKTSAALFKNNPFITANIETQSKSHNTTGDSGEHQERLTANVKKRTYLFESLPFDKIKHQNEDGVEAMVENIKGTLNCLDRARVLHSGGSIVEVGETMIAKKAKFLLSDDGPVINYDEVAEGGAQNFILQLVPRAHLKPRITYLKEDKKGRVEATMVSVGFQQERECKTAQLVQVVEDILHQDNSLRKGVIIQEDQEARAEVMVYSLYKYFDEEDVKHYLPPQIGEHEEQQPQSRVQEPSKEKAQSLTSSSKNTPKDQTRATSIKAEIATMGNVKLFKTCIEKGDLEYLKGLHSNLTAEEFLSVGNVDTQGSELHPAQMDNQASMSEWVPVDVEKLKKMFSGDQRQTQQKQNEGQTPAQMTAGTCAGLNMSPSSTGSCSGMFTQQTLKENPPATSSQTCTQDDHVIHKDELVKVGADCDVISNLQPAIKTPQQATTKAKTMQEKQKPFVGEVARQKSDAEQSKSEAHANSGSRKAQDRSSGCESSSERSSEQEADQVFQGKLQAALESLERSNINVTRGDFKAAMIYRNSSENKKKAVDASPQAPTEKEVCFFFEPKSAQVQQKQENADTSRQGRPKKQESVGPKPTIPPKPKHLKEKQDVQTTNRSLYEETNEEKLNSIGNLKSGAVTNQLKDVEMQQVKGLIGSMETGSTEEKLKHGQQNFMVDEKKPQDLSLRDSVTEANKPAVRFHGECQKMDSKCFKNVPIKPKRVKLAHPEYKTPKLNIGDTDSHISVNNASFAAGAVGKDTNQKSVNQGSEAEMRERKGQSETEAARRQRLSVHMDDIVKGNMTTAMEIFHNLQRQEELQSFLSRVEEMEKDTSGVDVRSLRGIFENVPDSVVSSNRKKANKVKEEKHDERMPLTPDSTENQPSMAHVFGNLQRASEEILNLKEQTLARLLDVEEAIKKALYSVSTLKSEADIAGLSNLFKESLATVQGSPSSANITQSSCRATLGWSWETPAEGSRIRVASPGVASAKQQASPPSSPAFISIQSAARPLDRADILSPKTKCCPTCQHRPGAKEKFLTTATLTCNGETTGGQKEPCPKPGRELSVLEVQTDHEGNSVTVTERTDPHGNRIYSSTTSTVITAAPEALTG